ncbi:dimethylaniline monooxygenase 2 [Paramyrothecium foliicola]|nr:dimethylaniline monooxygenase 2 [Paramyrothecium foliicola]
MVSMSIAIVGSGSAGLTALKNLREVGFNAIGFERWNELGGLWSFSTEPGYTSTLHDTLSNTSKLSLALVTFRYLLLPQFINFNTIVRKVTRAKSEEKWVLHATTPEGDTSQTFDKIVFATGCDTLPRWPGMPRRQHFTGTVIHAQDYKAPQIFAHKRVLVVDMGNTACDVALSLCGHDSKVYQAYRRGRLTVSRYEEGGSPSDCKVSWQVLRLKHLLEH